MPESVPNQLFLAALAAEGRTSGAKALFGKRDFSAWLKPCPDETTSLYTNSKNGLVVSVQVKIPRISLDNSSLAWVGFHRSCRSTCTAWKEENFESHLFCRTGGFFIGLRASEV